MAILRWMIGFTITICIAVFAVFNRADISVVWDPLSYSSIMLPLYLVALISMAAGFIFGGVVVWLNMGCVRKDRRKQKRDIKILEKEVGRLKEDKLKAIPPASDIFPALPAK